ncbi:hypothetical protein PR202_gb08443 [Eleusine coracana subsp. coracana]|uniref:Uncharacterized protein n=1 Tax=Eleusine coracana subsp. coracana TaxID=191504 RepID=A0AAV5EC63_ELECO|nr:hypothetical protein PR202_gb08443 [Eleusine coracana subsp. coracana]
MAGDKGKGKRPSVAAEHRGGEERGPKIRKVTQEEMGKRKGKLQIKERDKPMELEKARRMEEQGRKVAPVEVGKKVEEEDWQSFAKRMTGRQVDFYKSVVEEDCEYLFFKEELMPYHPRGIEGAKAHNKVMGKVVNEFKAHAAWRLKEHKEKGYLQGFPPRA